MFFWKKISILIILAFVLFLAGCIPDPTVLHRVHYHDNGSTYGFPPEDTNEYLTGTEVIVMGKNTLLKDGYTFKHWNTKADGTGTAYYPGDKLLIRHYDVFLYAIWEPN